MSHPDRARAESFGAQADRYDRARPGYPDAMVSDLLAGGAHDVLDVGCGTGIAGRQFLARGCRVLGVEPDPRMAAVARQHGLEVESGRFEDWDPAGRRFDLLVSGQSWHWIDPSAGVPKAALALRPDGGLAIFWNTLTHQPAVKAVLEAAYREHAPDLLAGNLALGTLRPGDHAAAAGQAGITGGGLFGAAAWRRYDWERRVTTEQWLDELRTHSIHRPLPAARLDALLGAIAAGLAGAGTFTIRYRTSVLTARRLRSPAAR